MKEPAINRTMETEDTEKPDSACGKEPLGGRNPREDGGPGGKQGSEIWRSPFWVLTVVFLLLLWVWQSVLGQVAPRTIPYSEFKTLLEGGLVVDCRIEQEVRQMLDRSYAEAKSILEQHRTHLDHVASVLLEKETLDAKSLRELVATQAGEADTPAAPQDAERSRPRRIAQERIPQPSGSS